MLLEVDAFEGRVLALCGLREAGMEREQVMLSDRPGDVRLELSDRLVLELDDNVSEGDFCRSIYDEAKRPFLLWFTISTTVRWKFGSTSSVSEMRKWPFKLAGIGESEESVGI